MRKAIILTTDRVANHVEIPGDDEPGGLQALQKAVGGYIQVVPILTPDGDVDESITMYCNEEGKLQGLPINALATALSGYYPYDVIVGDVILLGRVDDEGNTLGLTQEQIHSLYDRAVDAHRELVNRSAG